MSRASDQLKKGLWNEEEDTLLRNCIAKYGEGNWHRVPTRAGLNRCRKSCRLRWLNYLKPDIKRGEFSADEVDLLIRVHKLLGNRWSLIAGRLPGRTANDVKNYWNTHVLKRTMSMATRETAEKGNEASLVKKAIKPIARRTTVIVNPRPLPLSEDVNDHNLLIAERAAISADSDRDHPGAGTTDLVKDSTPAAAASEPNNNMPKPIHAWWDNLLLHEDQAAGCTWPSFCGDSGSMKKNDRTSPCWQPQDLPSSSTGPKLPEADPVDGAADNCVDQEGLLGFSCSFLSSDDDPEFWDLLHSTL